MLWVFSLISTIAVSMQRIARYSLFFILLSSLVYPCSGCKSFLPLLNKTREKIIKSYKKADTDIAKYYTLNIIPLVILVAKVERNTASATQQIEKLEELNTIASLEFNKMLEDIILIESTRKITKR